MIALFADDSIKAEVCNFLELQQAEKMIHSFSLHQVDDTKDWVRACLDQFVPQAFGKRLWICPTWHKPPAPTAVNVMLDQVLLLVQVLIPLPSFALNG